MSEPERKPGVDDLVFTSFDSIAGNITAVNGWDELTESWSVNLDTDDEAVDIEWDEDNERWVEADE